MSTQEMAVQSMNATMFPSSEDAGRMELIAATQSEKKPDTAILYAENR